MKRSDVRLLAGIILLVAGAVVLVYGITQYNNAHASLGNALGKLFTGKSQQENTAIVEMVAGGAAAVVGLVLAVSRRKSKR